MDGFMIDIFIIFHQVFYNEQGICVDRTAQLDYIAFDEKTAETVIESVRHALVMAGCVVMNVAKVLKPVKEVMK